MVIGFRSVPPEVIWNYTPEPGAYADRAVPYIMSIEANFAFVITLVGGMAGVPRLARTERGGYLPAFWDRACPVRFLWWWARLWPSRCGM